MLAREAARDEKSAIAGERKVDMPARMVLHARRGLERVVAEEAARCAGVARVEPPVTDTANVFVSLEGSLNDLFGVRTATSFAAVLPPMPIRGGPADTLARAVSSERARRLVETWTSGTVRYRIDWIGLGHQRARTWSAARAIGEACPTWVNDPTASTWELGVHEQDGVLHVELRPKGLVDPRFAYRVRDVPAASHPPLAAAIVRIAGALPDDVVWDPFVGSAVELVERALAGPYARLEGSDIDERALEAARANLAAAGVKDAVLARADALALAPARVNVILTNPPMGRRVLRDGTLGVLLEAFVDRASELLPPGGRLVWLSPLGTRTATRALARGFDVTMDSPVDMGGFQARLQRFVRRGR
jgi:23S rRNA G2445 N2-methylase RlmL